MALSAAVNCVAPAVSLCNSEALRSDRHSQGNAQCSLPASSSSSTFLRGNRVLPGATSSIASVGARRNGGVVVATATKERASAETKWPEKRKVILQKKVKSVSAKEAKELMENQGYTMLDIRPENEYQEVHPVGAKNVSLYRPITEWTPYKVARRTAFAFFGIFNGTEENPTFLQEVAQVLPDKDAPVLVACFAGGTTKATSNFPDGKQSRSLIAAYYLALDGYTNVAHLDGGLESWFQNRLPVEFKDN